MTPSGAVSENMTERKKATVTRQQTKQDFDFRYGDGERVRKNAVNIVDMCMTYPGAVKMYHTDKDWKRIEHPES